MRRWAPTVALLALLSACAEPAQVVRTEQHLQARYSDGSGNELRYLVWLPDGYGDDREKEYPLIVFLHGSGSDSYDSSFVISSGLPAVLALSAQPEGFEFVVISPQAQPGTTWFAEGQLETVDNVIQEALDTYLVDEDRVYLTGLSMGGYASWHLASQFPHRFAAMSSLSGSGYQLPFTPAPEYSCPLALVPIWGFHGEQDLISEYRPVALQVSAWESQCGARVKWTLFPDAGHIETYERVYRAPDLYDWMLEHSKN